MKLFLRLAAGLILLSAFSAASASEPVIPAPRPIKQMSTERLKLKKAGNKDALQALKITDFNTQWSASEKKPKFLIETVTYGPDGEIGQAANIAKIKAERSLSAKERAAKRNVPELSNTDAPLLYAVKIFDLNWLSTTSYDFGLFSIDTGGNINLVDGGNGSAMRYYGNNFAFVANNTMYCSVPMSSGAYIYLTDLDTYRNQGYSFSSSPDAMCAVQDSESGEVYGCFLNSEGTGYVWGTISLSTIQVTEIAPLEAAYMALGQAYDGTIYGINVAGHFGTVDKETGKLTMIRNTGLVSNMKTTGALDKVTGIFYYLQFTYNANVPSMTSRLYSIDTKDGSTKLLSTLDGHGEYGGMFIPRSSYGPDRPNRATDLTFDFNGYDNHGTVSFKLPLTNTDDNPGTGDVNYKLLFGDVLVDEGSAPYGTLITKEIDLENDSRLEPDSKYTVTVEVANARGEGPSISQQVFIGRDQVNNLTNFEVVVDNDELVLTWNRPATKNGGYLDYANDVKYEIKHYYQDEEEVVISDLSGETSEYRIPVTSSTGKGMHTFGITSTIHGTTNAEILARPTMVGYFTLPFSGNFGYQSGIDFTIIDNNNDGMTWEQYSDCADIWYNPLLDMDDWIILGPVKIPDQTLVKLAFKVEAYSADYPERIEVKAGVAPTVEAMNIPVLNPLVIDNEVNLSSYYFNENEGEYYFGFHACSDMDTYNMTLYDFELTTEGNADAPGYSSNISTQRFSENYNLWATVKFTTPTHTMRGDALTSLEKMELYLNGDLIQTFNDVTPGQEITVENVTIKKSGNQRFGFMGYNEVGDGIMHEYSTYIGWYAPQISSWMLALPDQEDDFSTWVSYEPITKDIYGNPCPTQNLWYQPNMIWSGGQRTAGNGMYKGTLFHDVEAIPRTYDQEFVQYYMSAYYYESPSGWAGNTYTSDFVFANYCPVGPSYTLPYKESFANMGLSSIFEHSTNGTYGQWVIDATSQLPVTGPYDADGGLVYFVPQAYGDNATLHSGKITLAETIHPQLSLYYFAVPGSSDEIEVEIDYDGTFTSVGKIVIGETGESGWTNKLFDLTPYKDKKIRFRMTATAISGSSLIVVDNIEVKEAGTHNVGISSMLASPFVEVGDDVEVSLQIVNDGINDMPAYSLTLYANGKEVASAEGQALKVGETADHTFNLEALISHGDALQIEAVIETEGDTNVLDDTAQVVTVIKQPSFPAVNDLTAEKSGDGQVSLSWSRPVIVQHTGVTVTEDVEGLTRFSNGMPGSKTPGDDLGGWTVIDADRRVTGNTVMDKPYVGIPADRKMAWTVYGLEGSNDEDTGFNYGFHSGSQCFICPFAYPDADGGNDDWLISPLLSGNAQTITFFAKSVTDYYGMEEYEVWYSTTGKNQSDFIKLGDKKAVDTNWQQDTYELPEGTRYFAIRCVSYYAMALMVDDIVYERAVTDNDYYELLGYNVYFDYEGVNESILVQPGFLHDADVSINDGHIYHVTAVYTRGESKLSNGALVDIGTGVDAATSDDISIYAVDRTIVVNGAQGEKIEVLTIDGKVVASCLGSEPTRIDVTPGIYVVVADSKTCKLIVK